MVTKEHSEHLKALHRAVYNDWGLYGFVQMLTYKCLLAGKVLEVQDESSTSKTCSGCGHTQPMPLWQRTYRCGNCGLVMDRDEHSAVNQLRRFAFPAWATHGRSRAVCGCVHRN
jgi:putative transposase